MGQDEGASFGTAVRVSNAVRERPPESVTVMVAWVELLTGAVFKVNLADMAPEAMVTLDGTDALAELLESVKTSPPAGAPVTSVTVPVAESPPTMVVDGNDKPDSSEVSTDSDTAIEVEPTEAEILPEAAFETLVVETWNVAESDPP